MTKAEIEDVLKEARERWDACSEAEDDQRNRISRAKQFRTGDQWPEAVRMSRGGAPSAIQGMPPMPPRPCLTIDRIGQPCRQISNIIKTANFSIDVLPNGFGASTDTADVFKGYLRYVQNQSRGESPIEWAADQAIEGGLGWFRITTEYVYEVTDGVSPEAIADQTLALRRIANNLTVYCDPWAVKPTRSDAKFMFVTEDIGRDEFERRWPKADVASLDDFVATGDCPKGWVDNDTIRIAEYWRITYQEERWAELRPNQWARVQELPRQNGNRLRTRIVQRPVVEGFKIIANDILESWGWVGSRIPLIPILGEEFNVDGHCYVRGIIEPAMDSQRMVNYTYSGAVEIFSLGSKAQFIAADDQVADYKNLWQTSNVFNYSYLPYKPIVVQGTLLPPPQRDVSEAPIQAASLLLQVSEEGIKATTGIYDPSLGQMNPQLNSGRMVQALQGQSDLGSSNYPDNVKRALIYAGELMVEIAPKITRVGQLLHILGVDDKPEEVIVGQPFQQQNGRATPVDPNAPNPQLGVTKFFDLTAGKYSVTVSVGKSYSTKREEGAAAIGQLIPALTPEMASIAAVEYVDNLSFPGSHGMAEKMKRALPPGLQDPQENQVATLQQQLQQAQAQLQQLAPLAQRNQAMLQQTQMREQGLTQRTALQQAGEQQRSTQSDQISLQKAELAAAASMANAQAKVDAENLRSFADALEANLAKRLDLHMEAITTALQHSHEMNTLRQEQAHEAQMAGMEHISALQQAAQAHSQTMQQQAQQQGADLQMAAQQRAAALQAPKAQAATTEPETPSVGGTPGEAQ